MLGNSNPGQKLKKRNLENLCNPSSLLILMKSRHLLRAHEHGIAQAEMTLTANQTLPKRDFKGNFISGQEGCFQKNGKVMLSGPGDGTGKKNQ